MTRFVLFVAIALAATVPNLRAAGEWTVLENCRVINTPANDGDSFHVSAGETEYVFRLYLVDTPEIESITPQRLTEQAKYFGITVPQAIEVGVAAKTFAQEKLSVPFKVFTHKSAAMGTSKIPRMSAFVQTAEGDLGEQLVRNGLARVHGIRGGPPRLRGTGGRRPEQKPEPGEWKNFRNSKPERPRKKSEVGESTTDGSMPT